MAEIFLFLGAGFAYNFGLPLAKEIWGKIFNSNLLKEYPQIEYILKREHNYENIYFKIVNSNLFEKTPDLQQYFKELINTIYYEMDLDLITFLRSENHNNIDLFRLMKFINRFKTNKLNPGVIFSINQDLFIERFYMNGSSSNFEELIIPFVDSQWNQHNEDISLVPFISKSNTSNIGVNHTALLNPTLINNQIKKNNDNKFLYIKLHGSFDWRYKENEDVMIIGVNKLQLIKKYKVLNENFNMFQKTIQHKNNKIKILIIGYSFNDQHINDILKNSKADLYVIDPQEPRDFYNKMVEFQNKRKIWQNNIKKYYCCTLEDIFPRSNTKSSILLDIEKDFFED